MYLDQETIKTLIDAMSMERFMVLKNTLPDTLASDLDELSDPELDYQAVREMAHKFRGMAANIGLSVLVDKATEIEEKARSNGDTLDLRRSLKQLTNESLMELDDFCRGFKGREFH